MTALAIAQGTACPTSSRACWPARGVTADDAERFLDPTIRDLLPDPASLTDMDKAAARLADAIMRREKVAIFGDYDVDGAASSALLKRFLAHFGVAGRNLHSRPHLRGLRPQPRGDARAGRRAARR